MKLHPDGSMTHRHPKYEEERLSESEVRITITARTTKEAKEMLKGVKRKYPKADLDELKRSVIPKTSYLNEAVAFVFSIRRPAGGAIVGQVVPLPGNLS